MCLTLTTIFFSSRDNMSAVVVMFSGATIGTGEGVAGIRRERERQKAEEEAAARTDESETEESG